MLTAQDLERKLKEIRPYLRERFQVNEIGYFGSFAENKQTEESDIDILVNFSITPGWEFFTLEEYLENTFNRKIDLVTKAALRNQLKERILKQVKYID
ncbi:nucleotidyltransferase [Adhaeribacter aerolatus]|uniref:Nucleotidyltransferase n=1 Tax=Adhaeribacter aerolatus TaxID=670289 RepID=A0A512AT40_9BACT|nr:nucleotidyltransferase family protein [Adhaeribacter aerolatus]GEO02858.1 nucleotidyltransferase [Adhaeribacter aerolatus]